MAESRAALAMRRFMTSAKLSLKQGLGCVTSIASLNLSQEVSPRG